MRLLVYKKEGKMFWKLSMHVETQAVPQNKQFSTQAAF